MAIITRFPTENGVKRLMSSLLDIESHRQRVETDPHLADAPREYLELFDGYRVLLHAVYRVAEAWWATTISAQEDLGHDRQTAIENSFDRRLAGPASHPNVVWIIRNFWLECAALNDRNAGHTYIRPEVVLLQWLIDSGETELVRLVACMPYWPVGLDENGKWC